MLDDYNKIREENEPGFYKEKRGLIAVWGKEAVQFLNGLITNDVAKLEDGAQMAAAFPNVQGRLVALVRVLRRGEKFLFETEEVTREKVFTNLYRFTFAGDFFVEDMSDSYDYLEIFNSDFGVPTSEVIHFKSNFSDDVFVPRDVAEKFEADMKESGAIEISGELYETLRIENGVPRYGLDMDETTVVLETGIDEAVNFNKGCYIGQEIIARIHFRGHVAKKMTGLVFLTSRLTMEEWRAQPDGAVSSESEPPALAGGSERTDMSALQSDLISPEGKPAGRITSITYSPRLDKTIALAYVRYEFLAEGTELKAGEITAKVTNFPVL
jgi:folate-binding protein YgfZ